MNKKISKALIVFSNQFGKSRIKWKNYKLFSKTQFYTLEELKNFQNLRLQNLLKEVSENVPYYYSLFKSLKLEPSKINLDTLSQVPFLTKSIIRTEKKQLLNKKINPERVVPNSTSGSSGEKTLFYSDKDSVLFKGSLIWRALNWLDLDFGDKELRIWGSRFDLQRDSETFTRLKSFLKNKVVLSSYKLTPDIIESYLKFIQRFKPEQIHAYPSSIYEISKYIIDKKIKPFKPRVILTSGEQLYPWQRESIENAFDVKVYNFYGCREVNIIAQECKERKGLHVMAENIILEVVNDKGENVFDEEGEIVVTDLSNYVFPFIRYKILDRGILTKEKCTCGMTLPLLKAVNGRTFDLVKLPNGGSIGATFFTHLFREKDGIKDFRIYQDKIDEINIEFIPENGGTDIHFFIEKITKQSDNLLKVYFKAVDKFIVPDSGKKQFIKSSI